MHSSSRLQAPEDDAKRQRPGSTLCTLLLLKRSRPAERNPCLRSHSTMSSSAQTILASNSRNLRCSRKEARWCQAEWRSRCPGPGNPCHGPCSTRPSCQRTSRPASSRIHQRNCKGRLGPEAMLAPRKCDGGHSTTPSSPRTSQGTHRQRSCMDRPGHGLVEWSAASEAQKAAGWAAGWEAQWEAGWGVASAVASAAGWGRPSQAAWLGIRHPQWRSSTPAAPGTKSPRGSGCSRRAR